MNRYVLILPEECIRKQVTLLLAEILFHSSGTSPNSSHNKVR